MLLVLWLCCVLCVCCVYCVFVCGGGYCVVLCGVVWCCDVMNEWYDEWIFFGFVFLVIVCCLLLLIFVLSCVVFRCARLRCCCCVGWWDCLLYGWWYVCDMLFVVLCVVLFLFGVFDYDGDDLRSEIVWKVDVWWCWGVCVLFWCCVMYVWWYIGGDVDGDCGVLGFLWGCCVMWLCVCCVLMSV